MLVPLGLGLVVRARYPELADDWVGQAGHASTMGSSWASAARSC